MEKTLILVKPDGVERGLVGKVLERFENRGLKIVAAKLLKPSEGLIDQHYHDLEERYGKQIRDGMVGYMSGGPVLAVVLEGVEAIRIVRATCGATYPSESAPGTIRGDFAHMSKDYANSNGLTVKNVIHASSDESDAKREIDIWFKPEEIIEYERLDESVIWE